MNIKAIDGKPVLNAKHAVTLKISASDVARADRKEPALCAVARACRRQILAKEVRVHLGRVYMRMNEGNWQRFLTPRSLRSEIIAFDRGGSFEPGTFVLSAPSSQKKEATGKRQGSPYNHKQKRDNPNRKKRARPHVVTDVRVGPA